MANLNFFDKIQRTVSSGLKLPPLKGHTKITLTNVRTGKREVHEDDNLVTNALSNFFANNYSMTLDLSTVTPVYKLFSGVYLFESPVEGLATSIGIPNQVDNKLIANAGDEPHVTASTTRGNPNGGDTVIGTDYVKLAWDWSTNQGNGTISCCCLTSNVAGNASTMPLDNSYYGVNCDICLPKISDLGASWSRAQSIKCPQAWKSDTEAYSFYWTVEQNSTRFEEITVYHDFLKVSLVRTMTDFVEKSSRVATVRKVFGIFAMLLIEDDYYYLVQCDAEGSDDTLLIDRISRANMAVTPMDITVTGAHFAQFVSGSSLAPSGRLGIEGIPKEKGYIYYPNSDNSTYYRISLSNTSDVTILTNHGVSRLANAYSSFGATLTETYASTLGSVQCGTHFIVGYNFLINGNDIYPCRGITRGTGRDLGVYVPTKFFFGKAPNAVYMAGAHGNSNPARSQLSGICLPNYYLATVNNLESSVTKEANQTMKVEYTITQA